MRCKYLCCTHVPIQSRCHCEIPKCQCSIGESKTSLKWQHGLNHFVLPFVLEVFFLGCCGAKIVPTNENSYCMLTDPFWRSQIKPAISPQHFFIIYNDAEEDKGIFNDTFMTLICPTFFFARTAKSWFYPCLFVLIIARFEVITTYEYIKLFFLPFCSLFGSSKVETCSIPGWR